MSLGKDGEDLALKFLESKNYKILARNYHSRFGEIDIIAKDRDCIVFVEVKSRSNLSFGTPLESITKSKLSKLVKTSQFYLSEMKIGDVEYRFDAIEVMLVNNEYEINHLIGVT